MVKILTFLYYINLFVLTCAWLTHVVACILKGAWSLLVIGAMLFPIGVVHGIGFWFGAW